MFQFINSVDVARGCGFRSKKLQIIYNTQSIQKYAKFRFKLMVQCQLVKLGWGLHLKSFPKATWLYSYQDISLQPIFIIHIN